MKLLIPSGISLIMALFYYLPWIITPRAAILPYMIAFLWFLVIWVVALLHLFFCVKLLKTNKAQALWHCYATLIIGLSYAIVIIGAMKGYVLTA